MISFAEEIAYLYYTEKKYFTIRNFCYLDRYKRKKQPGNVDIDLIAYRHRELIIVSCKRGSLNYKQEKKELEFFKKAEKQVKNNFSWFGGKIKCVYIAEYITEHNKEFFEGKGIKCYKLSDLVKELIEQYKKNIDETGRIGRDLEILPRILKHLVQNDLIYLKKL